MPLIMQRILRAIVGVVVKIARGLAKLVERILRAIADAVKNLWKLVRCIAGVVVKIAKGLAALVERILQAIADAVVKIAKGLAELVERILRAIVDVVVKFLEGLAALVERILRAIADAVKNLWKLVRCIAGVVVEIVKGLAKLVEQSPKAAAIVSLLVGGSFGDYMYLEEPKQIEREEPKQIERSLDYQKLFVQDKSLSEYTRVTHEIEKTVNASCPGKEEDCVTRKIRAELKTFKEEKPDIYIALHTATMFYNTVGLCVKKGLCDRESISDLLLHGRNTFVSVYAPFMCSEYEIGDSGGRNELAGIDSYLISSSSYKKFSAYCDRMRSVVVEEEMIYGK